MNSEADQKLEILAPFLDSLAVDSNARMQYEVMSDALLWSDELPVPSDRVKHALDTNCLRGAFRYRTTLIIEKPDERYRAAWEQLKMLCPNWPGFLADRQRPGAERSRFFEDCRAKALASWNALDATYVSSKNSAVNIPVEQNS
jgi:hypothetical protein